MRKRWSILFIIPRIGCILPELHLFHINIYRPFYQLTALRNLFGKTSFAFLKLGMFLAKIFRYVSWNYFSDMNSGKEVRVGPVEGPIKRSWKNRVNDLSRMSRWDFQIPSSRSFDPWFGSSRIRTFWPNPEKGPYLYFIVLFFKDPRHAALTRAVRFWGGSGSGNFFSWSWLRLWEHNFFRTVTNCLK